MYGVWVLAVRLILVILSLLRFSFYVDYREGGSFFKMETYSMVIRKIFFFLDNIVYES